jgi:tetratricopeptide (TPR) repeat protein
MKHHIHFFMGSILLFFLFTLSLSAQQNLKLPDASQHAVVMQQVGMCDIKIDYHRPGVKGRQIWGALVPYSQVWRAGANENTTISFSKDVIIAGEIVPAGIYGLHMIPTETNWTIILNRDYRAWGSFFYVEANDLMRFTVTPQSTEFQEWLIYSFDEVTPSSTTALLKWDKLSIPFKIEIDLHKQILEEMAVQLTGIPGFFWQGWNQAAIYCYVNTIELEQGLEWADRSIGINKNVANTYTKASILADLDKESEAAELKKEAFTNAPEVDVNNLGYQLLGGGKIDDAIAVFQMNTELYPDSWNAWDSLAEGYMNKGDTKLAIQYYTKALGMAPENQQERIKGTLTQLSTK